MNGKTVKKIRREAKKWAMREMRNNIMVYQTLPIADRFRIAKAILFRQGDGTPKKKEVK
jgi:hypothetical protein